MIAKESQEIASDVQSVVDNRQVYLRLEPAALALARSEIVLVNVDCFEAAARAFQTKDSVVGRTRMIEALPEEVRLELVFLEDCARALLYAHCRFLAAVEKDPSLEQVQAAGIEIRKCLLAGLKALIQKGVLGRCCLNGYTGRRGYHRLANDIASMADMLKSNWDKVKDQCPFTKVELLSADAVAMKLMQFGPGTNRKRSLEVEAAADRRNRMFTLLLRSYASVRREVLYHCWDVPRVSSLVPSLYKPSDNRKQSSKRSKEQRTTAEQAASQQKPGECGQPQAETDSGAPNQ